MSMSASDRQAMPGFLPLLGRSWWVLLVYGILGVIFGLFALARPLAAATAMVWALGVLALAEGVVSLFAAFSNKIAVSKGWVLLYAVLSIAFGIMTIVNPVSMAGTLMLFLAVWLVFAGIYRIIFAIRVRQEIKGEWLIALSGVLSIVLGILFAISPLTGLFITALWIGAGALVYGVLQIVAAFKLRALK